MGGHGGEDDVGRWEWDRRRGGAVGDVPWVEIVVLRDGDQDDESVDKSARQLRKELAEQELVTQLVQAQAPPLSKGDAAAIGAIAVALVSAGGMIPTLISVLKDWIGRRSTPQRIKVAIGSDTFELDQPTFAEREQLLKAFLAQHADK